MQVPPRLLTVISAVALAVAGTVTAVDLLHPAVAQAEAGPDGADGLNRFVVTPEPELGTDTPSDAGSPVDPDEGSSQSRPSGDRQGGPPGVGRVDIERFAQAQAELGPGGRLTPGTTATELLYVVDGTSRVVSGGAPVERPAPPASGPLPVGQVGQVADPAAWPQRLTRVPGVAHVIPLEDGTAFVTTSLDAAAVAALDGVAEVQPAATVGYAAVEVLAAPTPDDRYFSYAWHLKNTTTPGADTGALDAWEATRGQGAVVAILDSGFDRDHEDLAANLWRNPTEGCGGADTNGNGLIGDCNGWNFYAGSADIDNGVAGHHGAMVAGTVGALANNAVGGAGIAPGVTLMPLVVGSGSSVYPDLVPAAIRYAVDNGAAVINASFGGSIGGSTLVNLRAAVQYARDRGVIFVAAAGNDSANRDASPMYPANLTEDNVITVGSSTRTDTVAGHSAHGARSVDLFAPGEQILVTYNDGGYRLANGTSFASPLVAGAVAMYRSLDPTMTAAEIKAEILRSATPRQAFAGRSVSGGRLSVSSLGGAGVSLRYAFAGLGRVASQAVRPTITVRGPAPTGDYTATVWLGMRHEGEVWAVSGVDLGLGGASARTDDNGQVSVALPSAAFAQGVTLAPEFELPDGEYVLAVQVADASGTPLTRPFAAPLLVSRSVAATPAPTGPGSGGAAPTGTAPTGTAPTGTAPTGTAPTGTAPTTPGGGGGTAPGGGGGAAGPPAPSPTSGRGTTGPRPTGVAPTGAAPTGDPTGAAPTGGPTGSPTSAAPTGAAPTGAAPTGGPTSAAPTGAAPTPAPPAPSGTGTATTSAPSPGPAGPGSNAGGGSRTYPGTDVFRITRISPTQLGTAGGELVRIDGDIPANASVRVGASGTATVLAGAAGSLTFRAPARAAGVYDVTVHTPDRRSSTLSTALTYTDPDPDPEAGGPVPNPRTPTSAPSTTVAPTPVATPAPTATASSPAGPPVPSATARTSAPATPSATSSPTGTSAAPATPRPSPVTTPSGLRLVRPGSGSPLAAVGPGVWNSAGCETGCGGSQL